MIAYLSWYLSSFCLQTMAGYSSVPFALSLFCEHKKSTLNSSPSSPQRPEEETNSSRRSNVKSMRQLRPIIFTLDLFEKTDLSTEATKEFTSAIIIKLQETLALNFHAAEGIRIERRTNLAKSAKLGPALLEACGKVDSSADGDAELFGPEFREMFHAEAKNWKHHRYITYATQRGAPRGIYDRGHARGSGRGYSRFSNNFDRGSMDHAPRNWGKGYGGGANAFSTCDK